MDASTLLKGQIEDVAKMYVQDLEALTEEQILGTPKEPARKAVDFTYECAFVNNRVARRCQGLENEPWPFEDWVTAPAELQSKAAIVAHFQDSIANLLAAVESSNGEALNKEIELPNGETTTPLKMLNFMPIHMAYHNGQLTYIQALHGDMEMHWE